MAVASPWGRAPVVASATVPNRWTWPAVVWRASPLLRHRWLTLLVDVLSAGRRVLKTPTRVLRHH